MLAMVDVDIWNMLTSTVVDVEIVDNLLRSQNIRLLEKTIPFSILWSKYIHICT